MIILGILLHWLSKTAANDSNPLFIFFRHFQNYSVPSLIITCMTDKWREEKYAKRNSKK